MRVAIVAALVLLVPVGAVAGTQAARLRMTVTSPVAIAGSGFGKGERVRVTFSAAGRVSIRTTRGGPRGRFLVVFGDRVVPDCGPWVVRATGSRGSRALLTRPPARDCPPPPPVE